MSPAGRKGFTLVELAVVITVLLVFVPAVYGMIGLRAEAAARQRWQMEVAEGARTTAEWMALDAAASAAGPLGACLPRYAVDGEGQERVLLRELPPGCGVSQAVARQVEAISPAAGGVEVTFAKAFRPGRTERVTVFFPWPLPNGGGTVMRRGHSILLVLLALTAGVVGSALVHQRASFSILSTQADEVRSTALWLGRSALVNAPAGATRVPTDVGEAVVVRSGGRVTVELAGHRAELDGAPYRERYR